MAFFKIVQDSAASRGMVFFLDTGEGDEEEVDGVDCMTLSGWLVPEGDADSFENSWAEANDGDELSAWEGSIVFARWSKSDDGEIAVDFD